MKIIKFKKVKKNKYLLLLENNQEIELTLDIILKYNLLLSKEIIDLDILIEENSENLLYLKVLDYLNKSLRCESEIRKYLNKYTNDYSLIDSIIDKLYTNKLLDNELFIKSYIHDKISFTSDGPIKIKNNLINLELNYSLIDDYLVEYSDIMQLDRINHYISKYLKNNNKSLYKFKQKMYVNLINLGYEKDLVLKCLNNISIDEDKLKEDARNKLINKYSSKYNDSELENIIRKKLYEQGFR